MTLPSANHLLRRWDELPFHEVLGGIKLCVLTVDPQKNPSGAVLVCLEYPPNYQAGAHWHTVGHIEIVLSGTLHVGDLIEPEGSVRVVAPDFKYGPLSTRGARCRVLEVFPVGTLEGVAGHDGEPGAGWLAPEVIEIGKLIGLTS